MCATLLCVLAWGVSGAAPAATAPAVSDGSLLVLENCNQVVESWTRSPVGHVGLLFSEEGQLWVYEATPGQVRRVTLVDYETELAQLNRYRRTPTIAKIYEPREAFSVEEVTAMRCYLDSQLGRRYSISNYGRNRVGDGIHCAELASHTLNHSNRFEIRHCHRVSPARLVDVVANAYEPPEELAVQAPLVKESWCARSWRQWASWSRWCQWSYGEAWSWCD